MKNLKNIPVVAMCTVLLAACASESSVANYAIGDDSVAIKAGRNRAEAQISCAELAQHRR
jgi:putative cheA signal transduction histidine kinase